MTPVMLLLFLAPLLICTKAGKPLDCSDILKLDPQSQSGVYTIYPTSCSEVHAKVYCDMSDGGWTVIQRRMDGSVNFYRPWYQYVAGFGQADGEYWLGLENLHKLTLTTGRTLLVEMEDFEGNKASARYSSFSVGSECDGYKLTVSGFTDGGAGDSLSHHSGMKFSTYDRDQDAHSTNCAQTYYGGWWFVDCHYTNPNGAYTWGADSTYGVGVCWKTWKGFNYSLKSLAMKISPPQ